MQLMTFLGESLDEVEKRWSEWRRKHEVKKAKESGASKVGGLFGKVTGTEDAAKLGKSTAEIVVTLYAADGKTIVASSPASVETKGSVTDAVKAAIDQVIDGILVKMK